MSAAEEQILLAIQAIADRASQFAPLARQFNQAASDLSVDSAEAKRVMTQMFSEFPGLIALLAIDEKNSLFGGDRLPTDPLAIKAAISSSYNNFIEHRPSACFSPERVKFTTSEECEGRLKELCGMFDSNGEGQLSTITMASDLTTASHPVRSPQDMLQYNTADSSMPEEDGVIGEAAKDLVQAWLDVSFYLCAAASSSGQRFKARTISGETADPPAAEYVVSIDSLEQLRQECLDIDALRAETNMAALKTRYPDYFMLTLWETWIGQRSRECRQAVQNWCQNAYFIKGELILAYATKGCEIREVTAEDVDNDIRRFTVSGVTRADRLKHGVLRDQIDACSSAKQRGFAWSYQPPSLEDCHPPGHPDRGR